METLNRADVAGRAGSDPAFIDRLVELGILSPAPDGGHDANDVRRVRIVQSLVDAGLPVDGLAQAIRRGQLELGFVDDPSYDRFAGFSDVTFRELSARTSIPIELLFAIREATGSAHPEPDDRLRENELEVIPAIELSLANSIRPASIERNLRVMGEGLRRMAEVEADWWMTDVIQPVFAAGGTAADVGPMSTTFSQELGPLTDQMILALYHGHQANAWMKNIFEGFEAVLTQAGLHRPSERPPAICFLDLSGYTRLTDERGDAAAADLAGRLARLVRRTSAEHGGKPVKWLGDGVMFYFKDAGLGVLGALEMVDGAAKADLPPAHVGIHAGPVLFQEGDYFG